VTPEEYNLENLLSAVKETNIHNEYSDGKTLGRKKLKGHHTEFLLNHHPT